MQRVLEGDGYVVVTAGTGAKGLDLAAAAAPDLVILDLHLPDSDGIELVKVMRRWMRLDLILSGFDDERRKRAKLGDDAAHPAYIRTESGAGYRWIARGRAARSGPAAAEPGRWSCRRSPGGGSVFRVTLPA